MLSSALRSSSRVVRRPVTRYSRPCHVRLFSTEGDDPSKKDSLRDTVNRLKGDKAGESSSNKSPAADDLLRRAADVWETVKSEVGQTWQALVDAGKPKDINKKIHPVETAEGNKEYTGPVEIMVIDEREHLTAWERMQRRLTEAPIIQGK